MLVEATDEHFDLMLAGTAPDGLRLPEGGLEAEPVLEMLKCLARGIRQEFGPAAWMIVEGGEVIGLCSITKAFSQPSLVEIGYGIAQAHRGRGHAARAIEELLRLLWADGRIDVVAAETSTENPPSQRVLEKNGFQRVGERTDPEDGPLICWRIAVN